MTAQESSKTQRLKGIVRGAVQGVGFRPFVYRLATELNLAGWVMNSAQGVFIEVQGERGALDRFMLQLEKSKPPRAVLQSLEFSFHDPAGYDGFEIRRSAEGGAKTTLILPDLATCDDCLREIFDPANRRHRYPFTNCTNCGPRFSIIEALPYDRPNTSMKRFSMCPDCAREYCDPLDRRFDAQPIACPRCGPQLEFWNAEGALLAQRNDALRQAAERIRAGQIVALKGLGGFQLLADARDDSAITQLRARKHREEKPLAVMFPSLSAVRGACHVSDMEEGLLRSPESPIVLLRRKEGSQQLSLLLAPGNPSLGAMLPSTPLHHLLLAELGFPMVATSGNLSGEPICIDEREALARLCGIADGFLVHDRPIVRHMDDSVVRVMCGRKLVLRRARGFAPFPVHVKQRLPATLAVGAHLKNTVALGVGNEVFVSQHIGDLETEQAFSAFRRAAQDLPELYDARIERVVCDLHPDYLSTKYAAQMAGRVQPVQHHWAHVAACMAENDLEPPALGIAWDGTGYGADGTIWGGEFLLARGASFERVAHFRTFRLPGGEAAVRDPRRAALGVLHAVFGDDLWKRRAALRGFSTSEITTLRRMLESRVNAPLTSSAGRLFDAVAALTGLRERASFEGQAAMDLEFAITPDVEDSYPFLLSDGKPRVIDWQPAILAILNDLQRSEATGVIAAKFHNTLVESIVAVARVVREPDVTLSGGCFQNKYLAERAVRRLTEENFRPHWHRLAPPNDGSIALGQIVAAWADNHLWCDGVAISKIENENATETNHVPCHSR